MNNAFKIKKGLIVKGDGGTIVDISGAVNQLFSVTDSLQGVLMSVNKESGLPVLEVSSDDTIKMGTFGSEALIVSGSTVSLRAVTGSAATHIPVFTDNPSSIARTLVTRTPAQLLSDIGAGASTADITAVSLTTTTLTLTRSTGNLTASVPTFNQNTTGSAATLTTARNINGVSFNGSANINVPSLLGTNGTTTIATTGVTSAVNHLTVTNSITGQAVGISTAGSDTNIGLTITTKGNGNIIIDTGTGTGDIELKPGASNLRLYDDDSTHYYQFVTGNRTANYNINLPVGDVTLVSGTMVATSRTLRVVGTPNQVTVNNGSGNDNAVDLSADRVWTLSLPQNIDTAATPTFGGLTVSGTMTTNSLIVGTQTNKATINYTTNTARTYTIPNAGANADFVMTAGAQTVAGSKTFSSQIISNVATGTAPFSVSSTTKVANLNVATSSIVDGTSGQLLTKDDRIIEPNSITSGYFQFGFTTWGNNNSSPFADYLHLRSYTDSSGGNDNLLMFRKDVLGIRIYQQTFNSSSAYSTFKDVAWTDGTNTTGTWSINTTGSAATLTTTRTIWGQNFNGSANVTGNLTSVGNITGTAGVTLTATGATLALVATGTNTITASTNGAVRTTITSGGNLLIGTTTDTNSKVGIKSSGTNTYPLVIQRSANTNSLFSIYETSTGDGSLFLVDSSGASDIQLLTNGTSVLNGGTVLIGTTSASTTSILFVNGDGSFTGDVIAFASSDRRLKNNIVKIEKPLEKIIKLGGYTFDWSEKQTTFTGQDYGVIAQEVEELFPEMVTTRDNGYKAVKYEKLIPVLIEAIKELKSELDQLKNK